MKQSFSSMNCGSMLKYMYIRISSQRVSMKAAAKEMGYHICPICLKVMIMQGIFWRKFLIIIALHEFMFSISLNIWKLQVYIQIITYLNHKVYLNFPLCNSYKVNSEVKTDQRRWIEKISITIIFKLSIIDSYKL